MKRFLPLLAVAALIAVPVAVAASSSSPPVLQKGKLVVAFGDPTPGFVVGKVRGTKITNPKGYEVDLAKKVAASAPSHAGLDLRAVDEPLPRGHEEVRRLVPGGDVDRAAEENGRHDDRLREREPGRAPLEEGQGAAQPRGPAEDADLRPEPTRPASTYLQHGAQADQEAARVSDDDRRLRGRPCRNVRRLHPRRRPGRPREEGTADGLRHLSPGRSSRTSPTARCCRRTRSCTPWHQRILKKLNKNGTIGKLQKKWFNINLASIPVLK